MTTSAKPLPKNADERSDANGRHLAHFDSDRGGIWLYHAKLFTESNLLNITRQASINIVLAAGMTFIILTGGIDLSVGSILGTTAVAAMVVSLALSSPCCRSRQR